MPTTMDSMKTEFGGLAGMNFKALVLIIALPLAAIAGGAVYYGSLPTAHEMHQPHAMQGAVAEQAREAIAHEGSVPVAPAVVLKPLTFKEARANADTEAMRRAVEGLWEKGTIKKGMTFKQVMGVLGVPDNTTSRYVKGGFSTGYSALAPTGDNYESFFWLHFKADAKLNAAGEKVLVGWWAVK